MSLNNTSFSFTDFVSMTGLSNGMDVVLVINHHQDSRLFVKSLFYGLIHNRKVFFGKGCSNSSNNFAGTTNVPNP